MSKHVFKVKSGFAFMIIIFIMLIFLMIALYLCSM